MKIKGSPDFPVPPTPPEQNGADNKTVSKFDPGQSSNITSARPSGKEGEVTSPFEQSLKEIAKSSGPQQPVGKAAAEHIVNSVLEEVMGKEFMSKPDAARLKDALVPMISEDEPMMNKLNSILNRIGKT
jgi:protein tyrosine/serine phosphatase